MNDDYKSKAMLVKGKTAAATSTTSNRRPLALSLSTLNCSSVWLWRLAAGGGNRAVLYSLYVTHRIQYRIWMSTVSVSVHRSVTVNAFGIPFCVLCDSTSIGRRRTTTMTMTIDHLH
jgi:hypothetical protein